MHKACLLLVTSLALLSPISLLAANIPVPFTSQAPYAKWVQPWEDACEETSIAMVDAFYQGKTFDKKSAATAISSILRIKQNAFGYSLDENADTIASIINQYLPWEAHIALEPTLETIKTELDNGRPIIVPVYGRELRNPHFRSGGPIYHVLVITGYDDDTQHFFTREPGTRHGLDFRYSYATLLAANHDFVPKGKTKTGRKVMIFTSGDISKSSETDGDKDGLTKVQEIQYGTSLTDSDTDHDGYTDGVEVANGYSPTKK